MTTEKTATREAFQRYAKSKGLSELMLPSEVMIVPAVPLLGSGKPDMVSVLALAKERASGVKGEVAAVEATPPTPAAA